MAHYCDSKLLIRLYVELPESAEALQRLGRIRQRSSARIPVTWLHQLETVNALEQLVFLARRGRVIRIPPEKAVLALAQFDEDLANGHGLQATAVPALELIKQSRELSQRHTAKHGFGAYDVAHVASALILRCGGFLSFDAKANQLAGLEGLNVR